MFELSTKWLVPFSGQHAALWFHEIKNHSEFTTIPWSKETAGVRGSNRVNDSMIFTWDTPLQTVRSMLMTCGHLVICGHGKNDGSGELRSNITANYQSRSADVVIEQLHIWNPGSFFNFYLWFANCHSGEPRGPGTIALNHCRDVGFRFKGIIGHLGKITSVFAEGRDFWSNSYNWRMLGGGDMRTLKENLLRSMSRLK